MQVRFWEVPRMSLGDYRPLKTRFYSHIAEQIEMCRGHSALTVTDPSCPSGLRLLHTERSSLLVWDTLWDRYFYTLRTIATLSYQCTMRIWFLLCISGYGVVQNSLLMIEFSVLPLISFCTTVSNSFVCFFFFFYCALLNNYVTASTTVTLVSVLMNSLSFLFLRNSTMSW